MPKKFTSENTKATAAKARKAAAKEIEDAKKKQAAEDAIWQESDKNVLKKQQRKEENAKKKEELMRKKAEMKALLESETDTIKAKAAVPPTKVTRAQIQAESEKKKEVGSVAAKVETHLSAPLEENINRVEVEGEEARSITEAIAILSTTDPVEDKHPERRMKAAFAAFEERNMPRIKAENPTLRLSQLKQILKKEWMKSPDNPFNQILSR